MMRRVHSGKILNEIFNQNPEWKSEVPTTFDLSNDEAKKLGIIGGGSSLLYPGKWNGIKSLMKIASQDEEYCLASVNNEIQVYKLLSSLQGIMSPFKLNFAHQEGTISSSIPYLVLPFYPSTIDDIIPDIKLVTGVSIMSNLSIIVKSMHQKYNLVHQDLNPTNGILEKIYTQNLETNKEINVQLIDFGISKHQGDKIDYPIWMLGYGSPHQTMGEVEYNSDIWALGVMWLQMLLKEKKSFVQSRHWHRIHSISRQNRVTSFDEISVKNNFSLLYALGIQNVSELKKNIIEKYSAEKYLLGKIIEPTMELFYNIFQMNSKIRIEEMEGFFEEYKIR